MSEREPSTTAPTSWRYDEESASVFDANDRLIADVLELWPDHHETGKLMAAALDLRDALQELLPFVTRDHALRPEICGRCKAVSAAGALLAALPVLPHQHE